MIVRDAKRGRAADSGRKDQCRGSAVREYRRRVPRSGPGRACTGPSRRGLSDLRVRHAAALPDLGIEAVGGRRPGPACLLVRGLRLRFPHASPVAEAAGIAVLVRVFRELRHDDRHRALLARPDRGPPRLAPRSRRRRRDGSRQGVGGQPVGEDLRPGLREWHAPREAAGLRLRSRRHRALSPCPQNGRIQGDNRL